jgi:hypothetical protein
MTAVANTLYGRVDQPGLAGTLATRWAEGRAGKGEAKNLEAGSAQRLAWELGEMGRKVQVAEDIKKGERA